MPLLLCCCAGTLGLQLTWACRSSDVRKDNNNSSNSRSSSSSIRHIAACRAAATACTALAAAVDLPASPSEAAEQQTLAADQLPVFNDPNIDEACISHRGSLTAAAAAAAACEVAQA